MKIKKNSFSISYKALFLLILLVILTFLFWNFFFSLNFSSKENSPYKNISFPESFDTSSLDNKEKKFDVSSFVKNLYNSKEKKNQEEINLILDKLTPEQKKIVDQELNKEFENHFNLFLQEQIEFEKKEKEFEKEISQSQSKLDSLIDENKKELSKTSEELEQLKSIKMINDQKEKFIDEIENNKNDFSTFIFEIFKKTGKILDNNIVHNTESIVDKLGFTPTLTSLSSFNVMM
jgi:hypothetical protein